MNERARRWGAVVVSLGLAGTGTEASSRIDDKGGSGLARLGPRLAQQLAGARDLSETRRVLIRSRPDGAGRVADAVRRYGGVVRYQYRGIPAVAARLPLGAIARLQEMAEVELIGDDAQLFTSMDVAAEASGTQEIWQDLGYTGAGVTVAVLDSGVADHPDFLDAQGQSRVVHRESFVEGVGPDGDEFGHGTHVAGIIAGNGNASDGLYRGVAPDAEVVALKVLGPDGTGNMSDAIAAIDWVILNKTDYGIRVMNLSFGAPPAMECEDDLLCVMVQSAWDFGVTVIVSAGNFGRETPANGTIVTPAMAPKTIAVGAYNDADTSSEHDDAMTSFSSRGPSAHGARAKPDLVAPGNRIVAPAAGGSLLADLLPGNLVPVSTYDPAELDPSAPSEYIELSGTSMAAPIVAGLAALMVEEDPSITPGTIKVRLRKTADRNVFDSGPKCHPSDCGWGVVRAREALESNKVSTEESDSRVVISEDEWVGMGSPPVNAEGETLDGQYVVWSDYTLWGDYTIWSDYMVWADTVMEADNDMLANCILSGDPTGGLREDAAEQAGRYLRVARRMGVRPPLSLIEGDDRHGFAPADDSDAIDDLAGTCLGYAVWADSLDLWANGD